MSSWTLSEMGLGFREFFSQDATETRRVGVFQATQKPKLRSVFAAPENSTGVATSVCAKNVVGPPALNSNHKYKNKKKWNTGGHILKLTSWMFWNVIIDFLNSNLIWASGFRKYFLKLTSLMVWNKFICKLPYHRTSKTIMKHKHNIWLTHWGFVTLCDVRELSYHWFR